MKLTLSELRAGISWWLSEKEDKWPGDFHNSVYYQLYDLRRNGLSCDWWERTVDRLWDWRAIRSKNPPNTKKEIRQRGLQTLPRLRRMYFDIRQQAKGEPVFLDFNWDQIKGFYDDLAWIKDSSTPVFPSKLGHFIFPKLFIVMDHQATDTKLYDVFWKTMHSAWINFDEKQIATEILTEEIAKYSGKEVHEHYPFEIKIVELCNIGKKHSQAEPIAGEGRGLSPRPSALRYCAKEAWCILQGASPCRIRGSHPPVSSVA